MYISNKDIRARARYLLDDNIFGKDWSKSVLLNLLVFLLVFAISGICGIVSGTFFGVILGVFTAIFGSITWLNILVGVLLVIVSILFSGLLLGPIAVGMAAVHLELVRGSGKIRMELFFEGFTHLFENMQLGLMYMLHIILWSFLAIIPGIYMSFSYSMIFYVKHDNPEFTWQQCFDESERLMEGNRWRLCKLIYSFYGWFLAGAIAFFGFGTLWVMPYMNVSNAIFYDAILEEKALEEEY